MKIGLNGTGLTARAILKLAMTVDEFKEIEIVHVNGRGMSLSALRDRMLYSTSQRHSGISAEIDEKGSELILNGHRIKYSQESAPEQIPWVDGIELIIDSTGIFRDKSKENKNPYRHFKGTAKGLRGVVISAPGKGGIDDFMWVASPNLEEDLQALVAKKEPFVIGGASCTTTAAVPIIDTLDEAFGVESCFLTTIHAATRSQDLLDGSKGWSAFDTQLHTTGATKSTNRVLKKKIPMDGIAYRTSDKDGSFVQIDCLLKQEATKEAILAAFKESKYAPYISYPKVSSPPSSYIRGDHNMVMLLPDEIVIINKKRAIVKGLYDNEEGYAAHFLRLVKYLASIM